MQTVIFSKFSNERKKEFQILTKIVDIDGVKHIYKEAMSEKANSHIKSLVNKKMILEKAFQDKNINIVDSQLISDGVAELQYINGKTLDDTLTELLDNGDINSAIKMLIDFFKSIQTEEKCKISNDFKEIFGKVEIDKYCKAKVSNIDLILSNILNDENGYWLSDYEWMFDFDVPYKYILYRTLLFNVSISKLGDKLQREIYEAVDISDEDKVIFYQMEINFQKYVSGLKVIDTYVSKMSTATVPMSTIEKIQFTHNFEISSNKDDLKITKKYINNIFNLEVKCDDEMDQINIKYINGPAIIKIADCYGITKNGEKKKVLFTTNSKLNIMDDYYFAGSVPEIFIPNEKFLSIIIEMQIYYYNTPLVDKYVYAVQSEKELRDELGNAENSIILLNEDKQALSNIIKEQESQINYLHSKVWFKIYFKIRSLKKSVFGK